MDINEILKSVKGHTPTILGYEGIKKSAVLIPLIEIDKEVHILFEIRSHKLKSQPGDICFPGGRIDTQDKSMKDAALRETKEELCLESDEISNVFQFDYLVTPFGTIIYTFVGFVNSLEKMKLNQAEVDEVFTVPLSFFLETKPQIHHVHFKVEPEESFPFELIVGGRNYNWRTRKVDEYFYIWEDKVIWGLTAKIIYHFVELIK